MDDCCVRSIMEQGFRDHLKLLAPIDRLTCQTCGQVYELQRAPEGDTPTHRHYVWRPVTH